MHTITKLVIAVNPLGILLGYGISMTWSTFEVAVPWWLETKEQQSGTNAHSSLVWDSRLVPWIHAYDGDIQVSPIATND